MFSWRGIIQLEFRYYYNNDYLETVNIFYFLARSLI